jgi:hypothetical protein
MHIVVVDAQNIAGDTDFPMLELDKFGWEQFCGLASDEVGQRCWRADIIISAATTIDKQIIDEAFKLKLIVSASDSFEHIDVEAASARGIKVCYAPGFDPANAQSNETLCQLVVDNIHAFLKDEALNQVN